MKYTIENKGAKVFVSNKYGKLTDDNGNVMTFKTEQDAKDHIEKIRNRRKKKRS